MKTKTIQLTRKQLRKMKPPTGEISITKSSGNIFADMGCKNPVELQMKAELARQIYRRIKALHITQMEIAQRLNLKQPEVSKLANARHTGFSTDRLIEILNALRATSNESI